MGAMYKIKGKVVDIFSQKIYPAEIVVENGKITSMTPLAELPNGVTGYVLPGFIDSHVHIESSMLVPAEFAKLAVVHGTVATVSDPHEIANVCGIKGVEFMLDNGATVPFKFNFGAPSCVPATRFETAGASLDAPEVESLLRQPQIKYLSEMMNFPGVLNGEKEVMQKISCALRLGKPVDGHAPGLRGQAARTYIEAGISTDHECFTREEALEKLGYGMKILIREGSAAKNFEALIDLLHDYPESMMFCSDDKHPDSLVEGHINVLCRRAILRGIDLFKVLRAACVNPVLHYHLEVGLLRVGDPADFIIVEDLEALQVRQTFINGELVAENGKSRIGTRTSEPINHFNCTPLVPGAFGWKAPARDGGPVPIIEALDGQLITNKIWYSPRIENGLYCADLQQDILKIAVVNRYFDAPVAKTFIRNMGLKTGAIASSVAHDSHNIVAVGADDESICRAVNLIIQEKGGISCVDHQQEMVLPLPVGGLMSPEDGYRVAAAYTAIDAMAKGLGSTLSAPFMTLSFMALLVIPHIKLSDLGPFDGDDFHLL